jgi:hypothetical protein
MSNSPSIRYVILLHHQLLTASAHLRHRSRMQCNAGVCKTAQLHFRIHLAVDQWVQSVGDCETSWLSRASFPFRTKVASVALRTSRAIEQLAYSAQRPMVRRLGAYPAPPHSPFIVHSSFGSPKLLAVRRTCKLKGPSTGAGQIASRCRR